MCSRLLLAVGAVSVAAVLGCRGDSELPLAPASTTAPTQARSPAGNTQAPLAVARRGPVADRYIVVFKSEVQDASGEAYRQVAAAHGVLHLTYTHALKGYAATLTPAELSVVRRSAAVSYVEQDQWVSADGTEQPTPSWGLDRIDQRDLPLTDSYTYTPTGTGVRVYILDTGIRRTHHDFGGRAISGQDFVGDGKGTYDCAGHGTHVAGTVAGSTYGVAKAATLVAVRVLDCEGEGLNSWVIGGIDWVTAHRQKPAVANMSLGGWFSQALNDALTRSSNSGVVYTVAAGNDDADACYSSPASARAALTVAATDSSDERAWFSSWGSCVDLFAPGVDIVSDYNTNDDATISRSGTSMSAPHVAGAAALYLQQHPLAGAAQVAEALIGNATADKVTNPGTETPNRLLYMGFLNQPTDNWSTRAAMPTARRALAVTVANASIYAIGGANAAGTVLRTVQAYTPGTNTWTTKASLPAARHRGNGATVINGIVYVPGGEDASGVPTKTLYAYNPITNAWSTLAPMPSYSACGGSALMLGRLYVLSGCTRSGTGTEINARLLHKYDPAKNTWATLPPAPVTHFRPVVAAISGKLYVVGGTDAAGVAMRRVDMYDPVTNSWSTRANMPTARVNAGGTFLGGKLYVFGGQSGTTYLNTVEAYDPVTNSWTSRPVMPTARAALGVGGVSGGIFVIGGRNASTALATNERFTP